MSEPQRRTIQVDTSLRLNEETGAMVVFDDSARDRMRRFNLDRAEYAVSPPKPKEAQKKETQIVVREKNKKFENQLSQRLSDAIRTGTITPSRKLADRIIDDGVKKGSKIKPAFTPIGHTPLKGSGMEGNASSGSSERDNLKSLGMVVERSRGQSRGRRRSVADNYPEASAAVVPRAKSLGRRRSIAAHNSREEHASVPRRRSRSQRRPDSQAERGRSRAETAVAKPGRSKSESRKRSSSARRGRRSEEDKMRERGEARARKGTGGRRTQTDALASPMELARASDERAPAHRGRNFRDSEMAHGDPGMDGAGKEEMMYDKSLGPIKKDADMAYEAEFRGHAFDIQIHQRVKAKPEKQKHNRSRGKSEALSKAENYHYSEKFADTKIQGRQSRPNYPIKPQMSLVLADAENQRWIISSGSPPFSIGRSSKSDIVLSKSMHPSVSATHLTITFNNQNMCFEARDSSTTGSLVSDHFFHDDSLMLQIGDTIAVGGQATGKKFVVDSISSGEVKEEKRTEQGPKAGIFYH